MGLTPGRYLEILVLLRFLTPSASFSLCFDPGVGAGKLPALRAVVTGWAPLVTPGFYPAFPSPPHFAVFGRAGLLDHRSYIPPQRAHSGVLACGGGWCCPARWVGHKSAHRGLHSGLCCEVESGHIQLQFPELPLVESIHCRIDWENRVEIVARPLHTGLIKIAAWLHGDESCF